jgi:hypothetical protein
MRRGRPPALPAGGPEIATALRPLACALCLFALVGCSGSGARPVENDPFFGPGGGKPVPRTVTTGDTASTTGTTTGPAGELPELPAPNPKATTAGLASGVGQTLDTAPRLQIGTPSTPKPAGSGPGQSPSVTPPISVPSPTDSGAWQPQRGTSQGPAAAPTDTRTTAVPVSTDPHITGEPASGATGRRQIATPEEGYKLLDARGALHQLQTAENGQSTFQCLVPDRQNKATFYRYESTVPGDPVNAVRAVIDQIERDGR